MLDSAATMTDELLKQDRKANGQRVALADLLAYLPQHKYIYRPTGDLWPAESVNGCVDWPKLNGKPCKPSSWLDRNQAVQQMTWTPSAGELINDQVVADGGWIAKAGARTFNLYRPPLAFIGDHAKATRWRDHLRIIYPDDAEHIERWLAQRVQHPGVKLNHALVLGGPQGIGKDTVLEPVKAGIGPWNWAEVSPAQMLGRFNGWAKSVVLRVSEARDLGEVDRFSFYDHGKTYIAAPPDVLRVDEKNIREHAVFNVTGVIITTNHLTDGIYLPPDDRRHYVAWSEVTKDDFDATYWTGLWQWYAAGGIGHVVAFLRGLDLTDFDPKAPPPRTSAWRRIVQSNAAPEDGELADVLDNLNKPEATTLNEVITKARSMNLFDFADDMADRKRRRALPHRFERVGYVVVHNPDARDGLWKVAGRRQAVYGRRDLTPADQIRAARRLF